MGCPFSERGSPIFIWKPCKYDVHRGSSIVLLAGLLTVLSLFASPAKAQETYYLPLPVSDTDFSPVSDGYFSGVRDYLTLLNERDDGIGGVRVIWDECETEYDPARGLECYSLQRQNERGEALYFDSLTLSFHPMSGGWLSRLVTQSRRDKLPVLSVHHGRTGSSRGDVFPYQFPLGPNPYDFAHAVIKHMGARLGGMDALKGVTIVTLHHGSPYGRETNGFLDHLGEKYDFRHEAIEVPHPGNEQSSQWLKVRKLKPAFVFLRGWGLMNPVAIQSAARSGYLVSNLIGGEWSNSAEDVIPAGPVADGYQAATVHRNGADFPAAQEILESLYDQGRGSLDDRDQVGSGYWNLGVWVAAVSAEAMRIAQQRFGKKLTGAMMRWGLENVNVMQADLEKLGLAGVAPPLRLACDDHAGGHRVRFHQWDADNRKWQMTTDGWIDGSSDFSRRAVNESAEKYAAKHPEFRQRDCGDPKDRDDFDLEL